MADNVLVSLPDIKAFLKYPTPSSPSPDDVALQGFIDAAEVCIGFECDETLPKLYSERHDGGGFKMFTYHRPILEVKNLEEGWGWITYELDYQDANTDPSLTSMWGYSIDNPESGEISRRSVASVPLPFIPGEKNLFIQYVAGNSPVPANLILATKMLVQHWWSNSQFRTVAMAGANVGYDALSGQAYTRDTESGVQNLNVGVPFAILELIKTHRKMPIIA